MSAASSPVAAATPHLPWWVLLRVFWRSFFLQAAGNYERMQNVGFAYALLPALRRLHPDPDALKAAVQRHLGFFNSHPYLATAVMGAALRIEARIAAGQAAPQQVELLKRVAQGPLAAMGDSFFWSSLRPFAATWAIAGLISGVDWAPLGFLALHNLFHLGLRAYGLRGGWRHGDAVLMRLQQFNLPQLANRAHPLTGFFLGVVAALLADQTRASTVPLGDGIAPILTAALTLIFFLSIRRKMPTIGLLYGAVGAIGGYVLILNALFPLW